MPDSFIIVQELQRRLSLILRSKRSKLMQSFLKQTIAEFYLIGLQYLSPRMSVARGRGIDFIPIHKYVFDEKSEASKKLKQNFQYLIYSYVSLKIHIFY